MIRRLIESDLTTVVELLRQEPALNLYMLGNLETLGFTTDYCEFWGDFDVEQAGPAALRAVLNRYMTGWVLYGREGSDWSGLARILDGHPTEATRLQDNPGGIESFLPYLNSYRAAHIFAEKLMILDAADFSPQAPLPGVEVRRATIDDLDALAAFYADAGSMSRTPASVERPLRDTRLWMALEDGAIVSTALTNAETSELAMIGGVFTPASIRGRGLSQAVCSALCTDLFAAGRTPVLYWQTPAAGQVYRKLGFRSVGNWRSVWLQSVTAD